MIRTLTLGLAAALTLSGCGSSDAPVVGTETTDDDHAPVFYTPDRFVMGVDLSYVNQVLDRGGVYSDSLGERDPYRIFAHHGANSVRLRLWHDPSWVRTEAYGDPAVPLYSGLDDVIASATVSRAQGMEVLLDIRDLLLPTTQEEPTEKKVGGILDTAQKIKNLTRLR